MGEALITRRGGGGVDISSATATPEDVLAGKTFFSGLSDLIQTGTLQIKSASGSATPNSNARIQVYGLDFEPCAIMLLNPSSSTGTRLGVAIKGGDVDIGRHYTYSDNVRSLSHSIEYGGFTASVSSTATISWYAVGI